MCLCTNLPSEPLPVKYVCSFQGSCLWKSKPTSVPPLESLYPSVYLCGPMEITATFGTQILPSNAPSSNKILKALKSSVLLSSFHRAIFSMSNCWSKNSSPQFQFLIFSCNSKWCNFNLKFSYSIFVTILSVTRISREMYKRNTR